MSHVPAVIHPEVADALAKGMGVVALESTLITHGLPWPDNYATACESETLVRAAGAIPATIAILDGAIHIGLGQADLESVARSKLFLKASRRDLGWVLARRHHAATTVSSTLWIARKFGIGVMATGGLGGVHRGAALSFDISTDLDELAKADGMLLVCSGFKSILDLPATRESLETRGLPLIGYRTKELPAFTSVSSGLGVDTTVQTAQEVAEIVNVHRRLGLPGAIVLAQAVRADLGIDVDLMETYLGQALQDASRLGVAGKELTPFLLNRIHEASGGESVAANRSLIVANAGLAGEVATSLART